MNSLQTSKHRVHSQTPNFVQMRSKVKAMEMERTISRQMEMPSPQSQEVKNKLRQLESLLCSAA